MKKKNNEEKKKNKFELNKWKYNTIQKEEEEYRKMKELFSVEGSGSVAEELAGISWFHTIPTILEREKRNDEFINFMKEKKVVVLEDAASEFNMKTMVN